jgi:hypothetical protein
MCGTNLKGLGNAIVTYSNDNDEEFPRAGRQKSQWGKETPNWTKTSEILVWTSDPATTPAGNSATIGSCWYYLIKYADVTPKQLICNGDQRARQFKHTEHISATATLELTKLWDFGTPGGTNCCADDPGIHYSYSYHDPFNHNWGTNAGAFGFNYALTASSNPAQPIAADRNPLLDFNAKEYINYPAPLRQPSWNTNTTPPSLQDPDKVGNAASHQRDGQQVLYVDAHVEWEKLPNCGVESDHIYKFWPVDGPTPQQRQFGDSPVPYVSTIIGSRTYGPRAYTDSFLINEYNNSPNP